MVKMERNMLELWSYGKLCVQNIIFNIIVFVDVHCVHCY
jgi:hypothetical protein